MVLPKCKTINVTYSFYEFYFMYESVSKLPHFLCSLKTGRYLVQYMGISHALLADKVYAKYYSRQGSLYYIILFIFAGVLWLWHFLYRVGPLPVSSLHIYTFVVSRAFMAGATSQAGDADSSRAPGLASGVQGPVNVHRGALLLVPQWQCICSFVFYIFVTLVPFAVWSW